MNVTVWVFVGTFKILGFFLGLQGGYTKTR